MDNIERLKSWIRKSVDFSVMAKTRSGKPIHSEGNPNAKGWSANDHKDASIAHYNKMGEYAEISNSKHYDKETRASANSLSNKHHALFKHHSIMG